MTLHRVRIVLKAPLGTPLTSGTLFGHLCWARREADGEAALEAWLAALPEAPWALSDGFAAGLLPRPLVRSEPPRLEQPKSREELEKLEEEKRRAKLSWIGVDAWRTLRAGVTEERVREAAAAHDASKTTSPFPHRIAHNAIDRMTGSTPEDGGLYFVDEIWHSGPAAAYDVYVRTDTSPQELRTLFAAVGEQGYGRDATWGRGHFTVEHVEDAGWLDDHAGTRRMSLSHGCLTSNMAEPRYKLFTHFGKIGAGLTAEGARAWKYPILLARPGSTFRPADAGPFGAWLANVHQDRPEVGHNAFHLAVPYSEA